MTTIHEIVKILTDSGIEPNEANIEVKMLIEHFAGYGVKDIILGKKIDSDKPVGWAYLPNKFKILKLLKLLFNYSGEKSACEVKKKLILQKLKILSE